MPANYLPVLIFLTVATGLALVLMSLGLVIGRWQSRAPKDVAKLSPYECGFEAFEDSRMKFDVRYYLVAILFIVFDLEIAFLAALLIERHQAFHFGVVGKRAPEGAARQRRQDLSRTGCLVGGSRGMTHENAAAAGCVSGSCGIERPGDHES